MPISFNLAKLQRLRRDQQRAFATMRELSSANVQLGLDIAKAERDVADDPLLQEFTVERGRAGEFIFNPRRKHAVEPDPFLRDHHKALREKADKLKARRAQILGEYDLVKAAQDARSALLRRSLDYLAEHGIRPDLDDWTAGDDLPGAQPTTSIGPASPYAAQPASGGQAIQRAASTLPIGRQ